ncbi:MAG: hypothetical protein JNK68_09335, partial [Betaproteobacteria bacterium]|nr:hypothetical protein [Betaproteobacteria bacterium]
MLFAFFDRLSPRRQRTYLASDAIVTVALPSGRATAPAVAALRAALTAENRRDTEHAGQALLDELCARLGVPPLRVK